MSKIEELRAKLKLNDGCGCCSRWFDTKEMLSCVDELIQAVRDETIAKEWALVSEIEARGFTCGNRENALRVAKELGILND